jgi:hypothetical protein
MSSNEPLENMLRRLRYTTAAERQQKTLADLFDALGGSQEQSPATGRPKIWRIIMRSRATKPAIAAAVVFMAVLVITSDWMKMTAPAFGLEQIGKAMKQVEHSHFVLTVEFVDPNAVAAMGKRPDGWQSWTSRNPPRQIEKRPNGTITCKELDTGRVLRYDPEGNVIVVEQGEPTSAELLQMSAMDLLIKGLEDVEKHGAKVEYGKSVYEGRPVTTVTIDYNPPQGMHSILSLVVDPDTHLMRKMTWEQIDVKKGWRSVASGVADYPDSGPADIYAAGAPREAKVMVADTPVRSEPDAQFLEAMRQYDAAREALPKQWILVTVETGSNDVIRRVAIVYVDGPKERWESRYLSNSPTPVVAGAIPVSEGFEAIRQWAHAQDYLVLQTSLYDGKYKYGASSDRGTWHIGDKRELDPKYGFSGEGLYWLGWPQVGGTLVENDYAAQRGFMCIETHSSANVQQGRLMTAAQRTLYFLDPTRDYMCVRRETYQHHVSPLDQGYPKVTEVEFDPYSAPSEPTSVQEVVECGRLDTGQLYPKTLQEGSVTWNSVDKRWEFNDRAALIHVYIQTSPEFPAGTFDPNHFPEWPPKQAAAVN